MSSSKKLSLKEALNKCDYSSDTKEAIKMFIHEIMSKFKENIQIYLTFNFGKRVIVIKYTLEIEWDNRYYKIYLLMYIQNDFPKQFRIYFQKVSDLAIYETYVKNNIIDGTTLELYYLKLINFKPLEDPITNLIEKLVITFTDLFPLYKPKERIDFCGPCFLDENKTFPIEIKEGELKNYKSKDEIRTNTINKIISIMNEKYYEIQKTSSELENIEKDIDKQIRSYKPVKNDGNIELEEIIFNLKNLETKLESEINDLKNPGEKNILDECSKVIKFKDEKKFKLTVMKKTIEDYLKYIKKAFEKKLISYDEIITQTRQLSKELFFIMYSIEKRNNINNY